jgi:hypothetical protein
MNSHILERIAKDKNMDVVRSIELFVGMTLVISLIGFVFLAAV